MVITFVSNYINHHQLPFCEAMQSFGDEVEFYFVQTMPMEEKRRSMGWALDEGKLPYVILSYEDEARAKELILNSDVVLFGWTEGALSELRGKRLSSGKLSFCVSERIYREGQWKLISPRGLVNKYKEHVRFKNDPVYLLCTGAYVASDFALIGAYPEKMLKWGYFPSCSFDDDKKEIHSPIRICWAGRLIDLKHPEFAIRVAESLKRSGRSFVMDIIGDGPLKDNLEKMARELSLLDVVKIQGGKKPSEVLEFMKGSDIFLFTSNYLEGWGAVVNEAMGAGCAVVASREAGAVPFLIEDGKNGLTYDKGSYEEFEKKVLYLFENPENIEKLGKKAAETIKTKWNAENAAKELIAFCKTYLKGEAPAPAADGPMSLAEVMKAPGIIRTLQEKNRLE